MDLAQALLELVAPVVPGEALAGATLLRASMELGLRLTFEDQGQLVQVEVFPAEPERRHAARSEHLLFSYGSGAIDPKRGEALCRAVAERARHNEARVLAALVAPDRSARIRDVAVTRLLEPVGTPEAPCFLLSPYMGCLIGCRFCYAQERVAAARQLQGLDDAPWGSYVDVRADAPRILAAELRTVEPHPIKLCPIVSDPYHPIEAKLRLTRRCLEVLRDAAPRPVFVLTRARLVERDADVLEAMPGAHVGFSIPTADAEVLRWFEPRAAPIEDRLEVLAAMRARGIATFVVVQPPLPGDLDRLVDSIAEVADSVSLDVLRGEEDAKELFDAHPHARSEAWQRERVEVLSEALVARGVSLWRGDLP